MVKHLAALATEEIETWDDSQIGVGDPWCDEINAAIATCDIALLLISRHFLSSKFLLEFELPLLQQRQRQGVRLIPLIVSPCQWTQIPWIAALQAWPKDGSPLSGMSHHKAEAALSNLTREIADLLLPRLTKTAEAPAAVSVFISYSHDSDRHRARVLALSERLRADGIQTDLDRYVNGTPPEGWPRWMLNRVDRADRVLLVCTQTYYRRFRGHEEPGKGKGVDWEGAIITQALYDARSRTTRFIPVLFDPADQSYVPEPVRGQSFYCLDSEPGYQALYDTLLGQAGVEPGSVGEPRRRPRPRAASLAFGDTAVSGRLSPAARIWQEKLEFLRQQEAICSDPAQRFTLKKQIEEAEAKLADLS